MIMIKGSTIAAAAVAVFGNRGVCGYPENIKVHTCQSGNGKHRPRRQS
jgi:hypothetical protein